MSPRELAILCLCDPSANPKLNDMVDVKCVCGNIFTKKFQYVVKCCRNSGLKYHCRPCSNKRINSDIDVINKMKATFSNIKDERSEWAKSKWKDANYRDKVITSVKKYAKDNVELYRNRTIKLWQNDAYRNSVIKACTANAVLRFKTHEQFLKDAYAVHGNDYDYSLAQYTHCEHEINIVCRKCGKSFMQKPMVHLRGSGCPSCPVVVSAGHLRISNMLNSFNIKHNINDRRYGFEMDIFIDSMRLGIEYHGLYWHSYNENESKSQKYMHFNKYEYAKSKGIRLLQFFESDNHDIVDNIILHALKLSINRLYARHCTIDIVNQNDESSFFNINHLAGYRKSTICYGLYNNGILVTAMSFLKHDKYYEIMRYATVSNTSVVGGASKLLSFFRNNNSYNKIVTYADRRISDGTVYEAIGMKKIGVTTPGYYYVKRDKIWSRIKFQKHKLAKILTNFDPCLTEAQNMFNNGYRRIWDAGHHKYEL